MRWTSLLLMCVASPAWASGTGSQDGLTDEVVSVGQWLGTREADTLTNPISVIDETDINEHNQIYVADLLRRIPGVAVSRSGSPGSKTQIRMRGAEANHVLVLIDGVKVADPSDGEFDFAGLRSSDIIRIEVLRGEQSALYGSDAIGGVINIITRANTVTPSWKASVDAGSLSTINGQFSAVVPIKSAALSINAGEMKTEGYDISGLDGHKDASDSRALDIGLNQIEWGGLQLSMNYAQSRVIADFDSDTDGDGWLNDVDNSSQIDNRRARINGAFSLAGFDNQVSASLHEVERSTAGSYASQSNGTRQSVRWVGGRNWGAHSLNLLGEYERETYEISPSFASAPTRPKTTESSLAGDYRYDTDIVTVSASARQDFNDRFDNALTWKIGGIIRLRPHSLIRASVGTGIKNPTMIELFGYFPDSNFTGNPDLKPEQSLGVNLGFEQSMLDGDLSFSIDGFHSRLENKITGSGGSVFNQDGKTTRKGVELALDWDLTQHLSLSGGATFLRAEDGAGEPEIRRPETIASLSGTWQPSARFTLAASLDYTGKQLDDRFFFNPNLGTFGGYDSERLTLKAYTLLGLNAQWHVNDIVTLSLRGDNLLDEDYQEVLGYQAPGRGVYAGITAQF